MDDIRKVPKDLGAFFPRNEKGMPQDKEGARRWGPAPEQWRCTSCGGQRMALPFYMTYRLPAGGRMEGMLGRAMGALGPEEEDTAMRDLEYLMQMYPRQAKRYQEKIGRALDAMDYDGSLIYDEYPDRMALYRLATDIWERIRREEECGSGETDPQEGSLPDGRIDSPEYWENVRDMVLVLLYYEIFRRRRQMENGGRGRFYPGMGL